MNQNFNQLVISNDYFFFLIISLRKKKSFFKLDNLKYETLRPKFREQIENFTEKVYRETPPKSIRGRKLTGEGKKKWKNERNSYNIVCIVSFLEFFLMVQKYVEAMEKGAVPVITSTWESVVAQQNQKAKEESLKSYLQIENEIKTVG